MRALVRTLLCTAWVMYTALGGFETCRAKGCDWQPLDYFETKEECSRMVQLLYDRYELSDPKHVGTAPGPLRCLPDTVKPNPDLGRPDTVKP